MKKKTLNIITSFWFLKFIFDMFYQYKAFSLIISGLSILILFSTFGRKKIKINGVDILVIVMVLLWTISFIKSPSYYIDYFKIISAFVLYFLGRFFSDSEEKIENTITKTLLIVLIINLVVCLSGNGSIMWGNAKTLRGLYYFKTDFACMLVYFLIFWLLNCPFKKTIKIFFSIIAVVLILLANARIYYLITALVFLMVYLYKKDTKLISLRNVLLVIGCSIAIIFGISMLSQLSFFSERNMISLKFNKVEDLLDAGNTQGRNEIWSKLLANFNRQNTITKYLGASLSFNDIYGYKGFTEHSTYVKVLINTGYIGSMVFIMFILSSLKNVSKVQNKNIEYISLLLLLSYLISGISSPTILFINTSWLPMFFVGVCVSYNQKNKRLKINNNIK